MLLTNELAYEVVQQPGSDHAGLNEAILPHSGRVIDTRSLLETQGTISAPTPSHTNRSTGASSLSMTNSDAWTPSVKLYDH